VKARIALAGAVAALVCGITAAGTSAVAPNPNPWLGKKFLNIAHQGGEDEAPSSTMFAFKSAIADRGADMLELDVNLTEDGQLVVMHDDTVNRTTEETRDRESSFSEVDDLTLAEVQALDAGYTFRPGGSYDKSQPASAYPYRGIADGLVAPPAGYTATDFRIPTLREVLNAFPTTPINIEIKLEKNVGGTDGGCTTQNAMQYCDDADASVVVAEALAALLNEPAYAGRTDLIVVSFSDQLIDEFYADDLPPKTALAPGVEDTSLFVLLGTGAVPDPDVAAFQVPPNQAGIAVPEKLLLPPPDGQNVHTLGYAVHVWPNGAEPESEGSYDRLIKLGIDGYMASEPGRLHAFLCAQEIPRPDGTDRCPTVAKKKCKKKKGKGKGKKRAGDAKKKKKKPKKKCKKRKKKKKKGKRG
jgi:glycerophosphoryl diester phosphodiesterase